MRLLLAGAGLCVALAFPTTTAAQVDTATVLGTVTDSQGGVLPGVTVTARNIRTGFVFSGVADAEGRYRIALLPPGQYELAAELQGFTKVLRQGVTVTIGAEAVINFELAPAGLAEAVTVTADSPVVQTTTATVQNTVTREQIDLLPLIGRDIESLLRLSPAAQNNNGTAFAGARGRSNQWLIDGVDNSADISGNSRLSPTIDSIQEYQVLINNYKAEFGRATGGVINAVTRSGTNAFNGSAFFLFRDQRFMSRSPYAVRVEANGQPRPKDPFQRIHYGGTVGGPLVRDRVHVFAAYDREDRDTFTATTGSFPSATANFSPITRQFLAQNGLDLALFGAGGTNLRLVRPEFVDSHKATARIDSQLTSNQLATVRHIFYREVEPSGAADPATIFNSSGSTSLDRDNYLTASHKWVVSSNKLNEASVQFGQTRFDSRAYLQIPRITVGGGGVSLGGDPDANQARTDYVYQFVDTFTWMPRRNRSGEHVLKAGTDVKVFRSDGYFDSNFLGSFSFLNMTRFLEGTPSTFTQRRGNTQLERPNEIYGFFIQDDWRPVASLTLNLGLRYDYEAAKTEALREIDGAAGPGISKDRNNVGPRVGFVWAPGGSTRQAFYGGVGLYYDQVILNVQGNVRFTPPKTISVRIDNPNLLAPFSGVENIPPPALQLLDPNLNTPYSVNGSVGYRRELSTNLGIDVSYLRRREWDQILRNDDNAGFPGSARLDGTGRVRPNPAIDSLLIYRNQGLNRYQALIVDVRKRLSHHVQGALNYTLSEALDNGLNFLSSYQVPSRPDLNDGPGTDDRRHRIASHAEVNLPWDVQLGVIAEFRSEAPLNITAGLRDLNGDGITGDWVNSDICINIACPGSAYRRNSVREVSTEEANRLRTLLGQSLIAEYENNPKYVNVDATLQKRFRFGAQGFRVTAEAFNLFNIPQRGQPNQSITSSLFGTRTTVSQPRAVQLTFQYDF
ncbi:MAG TPA: TonB-dependent receptor [Vicinamibacterales bacterium]|nr:TonB-dependent receptor [Vicinamibacterales bacterium]